MTAAAKCFTDIIAPRAVSPLTVDAETFCADLPDTVLCHMAEDVIVHFAFVQPNEASCETAYVGTTKPRRLQALCTIAGSGAIPKT